MRYEHPIEQGSHRGSAFIQERLRSRSGIQRSVGKGHAVWEAAQVSLNELFGLYCNRFGDTSEFVIEAKRGDFRLIDASGDELFLSRDLSERTGELLDLIERCLRNPPSAAAVTGEGGATYGRALDGLGHELDGLSRQFDAFRQEVTARLTDLEARAERAEGQRDELIDMLRVIRDIQQQLLEAKRDLDEERERVATLRGRVAHLERANAEGQRYVAHLGAELRGARGALQAAHRRLEEEQVKAEVSAKEAEIERREALLALNERHQEEHEAIVAEQLELARQEVSVPELFAAQSRVQNAFRDLLHNACVAEAREVLESAQVARSRSSASSSSAAAEPIHLVAANPAVTNPRDLFRALPRSGEAASQFRSSVAAVAELMREELTSERSEAIEAAFLVQIELALQMENPGAVLCLSHELGDVEEGLRPHLDRESRADRINLVQRQLNPRARKKGLIEEAQVGSLVLQRAALLRSLLGG